MTPPITLKDVVKMSRSILEQPINEYADWEIQLFIEELIKSWTEGYIKGLLGANIEILLKTFQKNRLKADKNQNLEKTKEEILEEIKCIIFKKYYREIMKLEIRAFILAKDGTAPQKILDKLFDQILNS